MPLFTVRRRSPRDPDDFAVTHLNLSVPLSSATLWRGLFRRSGRRGTRPVAVVFELPARHWPVEVYLEVSAAMAERLLKVLRGLRGKGLHATDEAMDFVASAASHGYLSDLEITADNSSALGALLRHWLTAGASAWSHYDESVEVVIRTPVPGNSIRKLVPLSQTNREAKARRNRPTS